MEVCGTHTVQFLRTGIKDFFPGKLRLVDGPGCPVCVTAGEYLDTSVKDVHEAEELVGAPILGGGGRSAGCKNKPPHPPRPPLPLGGEGEQTAGFPLSP